MGRGLVILNLLFDCQELIYIFDVFLLVYYHSESLSVCYSVCKWRIRVGCLTSTQVTLEKECHLMLLDLVPPLHSLGVLLSLLVKSVDLIIPLPPECILLLI